MMMFYEVTKCHIGNKKARTGFGDNLIYCSTCNKGYWCSEEEVLKVSRKFQEEKGGSFSDWIRYNVQNLHRLSKENWVEGPMFVIDLEDD